MAYETATIHYNNYFTNFNPPLPRIGTLYGEIATNYDRMCVLKYLLNEGHWRYELICVKSSNLFYILNPNETITTNVNQWAQTRVNNFYNSKFNSSNVSVNVESPFPEPSPTLQEGNIVVISGSTFYESEEPYHMIVDCDVPIFTITKEDFQNLNDYISTGDDSGADNYEQLHPTIIEYHMYRDGKNYPNYYIQQKIISGEPVNSVFVTNKIPSHFNLNNGEMKLLTFSELARDSDNFTIQFVRADKYEGTPILPNAYCVQATLYSTGLGTIDISPSGNGTATLYVHPKPPTEEDYEGSDGEYPNDPSSTDTTQTYNRFGGDNILTKTYMLNEARVRQLGNFLWSSTFKDNLFSLVNYPLENIVSLKAMPITNGGNDEEIKIGNVSTGVNGKTTTNASNYEATVGTLFIPLAFNNFIDYNLTKIEIFLPYIGLKELPTSEVMNRTIKVMYYYDLILGTCLADVMVETVDNNSGTKKFTTILTAQGNCGIDIPISSTNRASIENGYINNALSFVGNIVSGNIGGAIGNATSGLTQDFHSQSTGVGNPSLMVCLPDTCYVIITRPKKYLPDNYGHVYGYPCYLYKKLSNLEGYTVVDDFQTNEIPNATEEEKMLIKQLMESGVYIHLQN